LYLDVACVGTAALGCPAERNSAVSLVRMAAFCNDLAASKQPGFARPDRV
jgi:hypothetical protein